MHRRHVKSVEMKLLTCLLSLLVLPADAAQTIGHFNITVNFQSEAATAQPTTSASTTQSTTSTVQSRPVQTLRPTVSSAQFATGSIAQNNNRYINRAVVSEELGMVTYWHMVNLHGGNNDPDHSYLEMLIGW